MAILLGSQGRANVGRYSLLDDVKPSNKTVLAVKGRFSHACSLPHSLCLGPMYPSCRSPLDPVSCSSCCVGPSFPVRKQQLGFSMALASHPST